MAKKGKKYYVVWVGQKPGIYEDWASCRTQVKGYPGASFKAFPTRQIAQEAFEEGPSYQKKHKPKEKQKKLSDTEQSILKEEEIIADSWAVDAACSGNPGPMEYRGVHVADGTELFHKEFPLGTNNIGEFLAIVHALALAKKTGNETRPIYTDSNLALGWIQKGKCKTKLPLSKDTKILFEVIKRAEKWLAQNTWQNPLLKWDTSRWGEIPADFGRKK